MNKIGIRIRKIRELKGLSQDNLAIELRISQPSYARLEKDDDRISITRFISIANILKISASDLLDEKISKEINLHNCDNLQAYVDTISQSDKEHIQTLKNEIVFLRKLLEDNIYCIKN
ncbi:MAG: helix-turn-helix transcriptional regulator [Flavobacterium sp.]